MEMYKSAAAKSLQPCPTLCNPTDGGPPGSAVPGILQARTLEWVAISFSNAWQWKVKVKSLQSCLTFRNPADCSLPGSSVHGIFQARVLEWAAISFSRWSSQLRDWTLVSHIAGRCFNLWATREALQDLLELTPKRDDLFIIGDWNAKIGSQEIPGVIGKFALGVQNEAGQRLAEFSQGDQTSYSKYPLPTQEKTLHIDITRWSIPKSDWLYSLQPKME